jgi:riboflavin kinase/FMN adenylyltransferase
MRVTGIVVRGKGEARTIGYPTANIDYESTEILGAGVWLCSLWFAEKKYHGLAIIDMWKQPNGLPSLEVHILDFDRDLYGEKLSVELLEKIRDLEKFTNIETLLQRIKQDIVTARGIFVKTIERSV